MATDPYAGAFGAPGQPVDTTGAAVTSSQGAYGVAGQVASLVPVSAAPNATGQDVGNIANVRPGEGQRSAGFLGKYGRLIMVGSVVVIAATLVWKFVLSRKG